MSNLKNIREKLSLSQQEMAQWLGISRSQEELFENGNAGLPEHALVQLSKLETLLLEIETEQQHKNGLNGKSIANDLELTASHKRMHEHLEETAKLKKQLALLQARHASLAQQLTLVNQLMDDPNGEKSEKEKLWLKMVYYQLSTLSSKFDEEKQLWLKGRILRLQMELALMGK